MFKIIKITGLDTDWVEVVFASSSHSSAPPVEVQVANPNSGQAGKKSELTSYENGLSIDEVCDLLARAERAVALLQEPGILQNHKGAA